MCTESLRAGGASREEMSQCRSCAGICATWHSLSGCSPQMMYERGMCSIFQLGRLLGWAVGGTCS